MNPAATGPKDATDTRHQRDNAGHEAVCPCQHHCPQAIARPTCTAAELSESAGRQQAQSEAGKERAENVSLTDARQAGTHEATPFPPLQHKSDGGQRRCQQKPAWFRRSGCREQVGGRRDPAHDPIQQGRGHQQTKEKWDRPGRDQEVDRNSIKSGRRTAIRLPRILSSVTGR